MFTALLAGLTDCRDGQNAEALGAFRDALVRSKALAHVDLTFNLIETEGAKLLLPALAPVGLCDAP